MNPGNTPHGVFRISIRGLSVMGLLCAVLVSGGCEQGTSGPLPQNGSNAQPGGTATDQSGPIVRFTTPSESLNVPDDGFAAIQFSVDTASAATVGLFLDPDQEPANGNEVHFAQGLAYQPGVTQANIDLTAGFYPYGTYFVKARATDGNKMNYYSAPGLVNIVSSGQAIGSDDGLADLAGLQLLHDSGKPRAMNDRIPFVDTWYIVDVLDNLSPRVVVPVAFAQPVEIHRIQFYVFGFDQPRDKRVEIYQGTSDSAVGEKLLTIDRPGMVSRRNGWWNTITPDAPITLPAGHYGFSYHAALEFTEHWAGNAPIGEGFAWVSLVEGAPFLKVSEAEMGFPPNFGVRVIGKFAGKAGAAPRIRLPDRRAEQEEIAADNANLSSAIEDPLFFEYKSDKTRRLHTVWRHASVLDR